MNNLSRWWISPYLPEKHILIDKNKMVRGNIASWRLYFKRWFIHPIKRRYAKYYLLLLRSISHLTVIGISGSAGKTTTKDMLASILKNCGNTVSSYKNIDPVYNIPDTILKASPFTKYMILEMGVEFPGEMDYYLWLAKPDVGLVTNIYPTHTEYFGNTEGVFREKSKLLLALDTHDTAVVNYENSYLKKFSKDKINNLVFFGKGTRIFADKVHIDSGFGTNFRLNIKGRKIDIRLPIAGKQYVENALSAAAVASTLDIKIKDIKKGLETYEMPEHRMKFIQLKNDVTLFDDSYNSNPVAAKRAISALNEIAKDKTRVVVFGDMLELGKKTHEYHEMLGKYIAQSHVDFLIGVGPLSKFTVEAARKNMNSKNVFWVKTSSAVTPIIKKIMTKGMFILIKGSRGIGLDKVVSQLS